MVAALIRARRGHRAIGNSDCSGDDAAIARMLDPHAPDRLGERPAANDDVAAGVQGEVGHACVEEDLGAALDSPSLDQARGVEPSTRTLVERAAGLLTQGGAALEHPPDVAARVAGGQLTTVDAVDLALVAIG